MEADDTGVHVKLVLGDVSGLDDSGVIFKIISALKDGKNLFFPDLKFRIIGYRAKVDHTGTSFTFEILPTKDVKLEEVFAK